MATDNPYLVQAQSQGAVRRATRSDASIVSELRLSCYRNSDSFVLLQPEAISWGPADDRNVVLIAQDWKGTLLSTTRAMVVANGQEADDALGCLNDFPASLFPAVLLGRGATRQVAGGGGLHSLLRYHFIRAAQDANAGSMLGIVYEGAPRTRLMTALGYEFVRPPQVWDPELRPLRPVLVGALPRERFASAIEQLRLMLADLLIHFPFRGAPLAFLPTCASVSTAGDQDA
jgi:hypothetical protein